MRSSVPVPGDMHDDHGLLLDDSRGEYATRWARKRTLLHAVAQPWNAVLPVMKQAPEWNSRIGIQARNPGRSTLPSYAAVTRSLVEPVAAMTAALVQDPIPCKRNAQKLLGPYFVMGNACVGSRFDDSHGERRLCFLQMEQAS
jgi:hypothetical protein